jgi:hypothetical protein
MVGEQRRLMVLLAVLGVLAVVLVGRMVLAGGEDEGTTQAPVTESSVPVAGDTTPSVEDPTGTTVPTVVVPDEPFDVFATRNPFEPLATAGP